MQVKSMVLKPMVLSQHIFNSVLYNTYHTLLAILYVVSCTTLYYMVVCYTWAILSGHHQSLCSTHGDAGHWLHIQKGHMLSLTAIEAYHCICHRWVHITEVGIG